ncbi:low-density lipoprotein receptor class A domain-containing protein 2 isoform X2 [Xenopus tropicalis]|uniref:Low-density lipoprotein receptor class A domain-containing protein 2 isoform X2 n=1 Tax=Xenopus tropicalis TaxID=8364 RepID=A0A8J1JZV1_XENTR|nr:low-density lipoprotein receptor class A domain-containing protein 2 isoform X2 [Xenopus tropicalis]
MGTHAGSCSVLPHLFVLLSFMVSATQSLETVNLVDFCGQTVRGDGMIVNSHSESRKYYFVSMGTDCRLTMQASALKDKVQFQFRFFLVYSLLRMSNAQSEASGPGTNSSGQGASAPEETKATGSGQGSHYDPCNSGSYVQFYDGKDQNSEPLGTPLCGKTIPRPVLSTGNFLTLRLVTRGQQPRVDFVGDFTSFRIGGTGARNLGDVMATPTVGLKTFEETTLNLSYGTAGNQQLLHPEMAHPHGTAEESKSYTSLLYLYVILGLAVGVALLFWCCWSPGWFIWRISICRFIPCCNSFCASCHLCTRSCTFKEKCRPGKVTPQSAATTVPV